MTEYALGAVIDLANPVNWGSPFAVGLQWFGLTLRGLLEGVYWYNLCGIPGALEHGRHARLVNITPTDQASGLRATARPGAFGELRLDQADDYAEVENHPTLQLATNFTMGFWLFIEANQGNVVTKFSHGAASSGSQLRGIRLQSTQLFVGEQNANIITVTAPTLNAWVYVVLTSRSAGSEIYFDAVSVGTGASLTQWFDHTGPMRIGRAEAIFFGSTASPFLGRFDALALWNRPMHTDDVERVTSEAARSFPSLLRRVTRGNDVVTARPWLYYARQYAA